MHEQRVILELLRDLPRQVTPARLAHIQRVAGFSRALARRFGQDPHKARIAAYAHDLAREWSAEQLLLFCGQHAVPVLAAEHDKPLLLHGKAAVVLLQKMYGYADPEVLEAVECHTLGKKGMGPLALILFVADYAEPGRRYLDKSWRSSLKSVPLPEMVAMVIRHAIQRHKECHPLTRELLAEVESRSQVPAARFQRTGA